jgi:uncharacterized protein (TIGR02444 family)
MKFWPWALAAYARPDVAPACLDLQDSHRQSVLYLLWAAWAAQGGRPLPASALTLGASLAGRWEQTAVRPLRQARRGLKSAFEGVSDPVREQLRAEVKALELKAEEVAMRALEAIAPEPSGGPYPVRDALAAAVAAWPCSAPEAALLRLAQALG